MMAVKLARRSRAARWVGCLVLWGALAACRGSGGDEAREAREERAQTRAEADADPSGMTLVRPATRAPDGGMPDGGRVRYELEGVPSRGSREAGQAGTCPPGEYLCCNGSCSPHRSCPGIACDPVPTFTE